MRRSPHTDVIRWSLEIHSPVTVQPSSYCDSPWQRYSAQSQTEMVKDSQVVFCQCVDKCVDIMRMRRVCALLHSLPLLFSISTHLYFLFAQKQTHNLSLLIQADQYTAFERNCLCTPHDLPKKHISWCECLWPLMFTFNDQLLWLINLCHVFRATDTRLNYFGLLKSQLSMSATLLRTNMGLEVTSA